MIREFSQNIDDDIGSMLFFFSREASDESMGNWSTLAQTSLYVTDVRNWEKNMWEKMQCFKMKVYMMEIKWRYLMD